MKIPVIDIFAGPGGLGEGFNAYLSDKARIFKTVLSIEMDHYAHRTLILRCFYRLFNPKELPEDYYNVLRGKLTVEELFEKWPEQAEKAKKEAWKAKLGYDDESEDPNVVDERIREALPENKEWVLIGGPPCQAYSVVGRSRRQERVLDPEKDERVDLYKQYLRLLAFHSPAVFVMENVKGLLSARMKESPVFSKILHDLKDPVAAYSSQNGKMGFKLNKSQYKIYSLVVEPRSWDLNGDPIFNQNDFIIRCEEYGIPQTRHRVILLGIRKDIDFVPRILNKQDKVPLKLVLAGLPRLRSGLSRQDNTNENWQKSLRQLTVNGALENVENKVADQMKKTIQQLRKPQKGHGGDFVFYTRSSIKYKPDWYEDLKLDGVCNHESRGHMCSDLHRYLFLSSFGRVHNTSPTLSDFPESLLPNHKNVQEALKTKKFADRFRVQLYNKPAKTITSHISKDGHYYIHPDPSQCRSLTVREAARIQTFPDNYYFCGPRTAQFIQVGNAVPPLLARNIATIVHEIFQQIQTDEYRATKTI